MSDGWIRHNLQKFFSGSEMQSREHRSFQSRRIQDCREISNLFKSTGISLIRTVIGAWLHPIPSRTRKLSEPPFLAVLHSVRETRKAVRLFYSFILFFLRRAIAQIPMHPDLALLDNLEFCSQHLLS